MIREERPKVKDLEFSNEFAVRCDEVINITIAVGRIIMKNVVNLIRHGILPTLIKLKRCEHVTVVKMTGGTSYK